MRKFIKTKLSAKQRQDFMFFLTLNQTILVFMCLQYMSFENSVRKGEIACNELFLLFHTVFYPFEEFSAILI